ncbi:serine protease inhibitor swm-1-like [Cotesia glomerata]|uniref:serine protease inhibitor swm-1-like n=1 Tax=Cotesia glomerata TaxID=32391 RepID=UPI001D017211|nr:serine protease inhibitor swm-1-like [Cotesia glomerata]
MTLKLILKILISISLISLINSKSVTLPGNCATPCTGGKHDICVSCANNCEKTCWDPDGPDSCSAEGKLNSCECQPGYVRGPDKKCILLQDCPSNFSKIKQKCPPCMGGPHDKCVTCASGCPLTCQSLPTPAVHRFCTQPCKKNSCECEYGYVRDNLGWCIKSEYCPNLNDDSSYYYDDYY